MINVLSKKHPVPVFTPDQIAGYEFGRDMAIAYRDGELELPLLEPLADVLESEGFKRCTIVGENDSGKRLVIPMAFSNGEHVVAVEMFVGPFSLTTEELSSCPLRFRLRDTLKNRYFLRAKALKVIFERSGIIFAYYFLTDDYLKRFA